MSRAALEYVEQMCAHAGRALTPAERLVLRAVSLCFDDAKGYARIGMPKLAKQSLQSERNARRMVAKLEEKGLLQRHWTARNLDGSQGSNEYELPGMAGVAVASEDGNQQASRASHTRVAMQLKLSGTVSAGGLGPVLVVDSEPSCPGVGGHICPGPPGQLLSALVDVFKDSYEVLTPPTPSCDPQAVETPSKSISENGRARTTASATAKATTSLLEAARCSPEAKAGRPESGRGAAGFRTAIREREVMDGVDAALHDEAMRVLRGCGISVEDSTRRLRRSVVEAMREYLRKQDVPVARVGDMALSNWASYKGTAHLFRGAPVGVRKFFTDGLWHQPQIWPVDPSAARRAMNPW